MSKSKSERIRRMVLDAKNVPCYDCGTTFPYYVMHLDHRDPLTKLVNPAQLHTKARTYWQAQEELDKCDAVCANCHAERTARQGLYSVDSPEVLIRAGQLELF